MKEKFLKFLTFFLILGFTLGCDESSPKVVNSNSKKELGSENFATFKNGEILTLTSVTGDILELERVKNGFRLKSSDKILMFDIFGTFCIPCQNEAENLMKFQIDESESFILIGLIHFEDISDESVIENFVKKFNAYYFIANSKNNPNDKIIAQILDDINFKDELTIPFKVIYNKNGEVEKFSNFSSQSGRYYHSGEISAEILKNDILRIKESSSF